MTIARSSVGAALVAMVVLASPRPAAQRSSTIAQFLSPAYPFSLVAAKKVDRIAWLAYEEGRRNVYVAGPPEYVPQRVTSFADDDGTEISDLRVSDDGGLVVFVRGTAPNRSGWVANAASHPDGAERAIWAARTSASTVVANGPPARGNGAATAASAATRPSTIWRVAEGSGPELAPDGSAVLFVKDGQIYRATLTGPKAVTPRDRGEEPFIRSWGTNSAPQWSPDGTKISFVSNRVDHSFIGVYDVAKRAVTFLAPSVDRDTSPTWSPDSKRIAFLRRPGLPFGQQAQEGGNGVGLPPGPANAAAGRGGRGDGRGGGRGTPPSSALATPPATPAPEIPGLMRAAFRGGYTLSLMVADVATGDAKEVWHTTPDERVFTGITAIRWAGGHVVFTVQVPDDDWDRYFSVAIDGSTKQPITLISTDGLIENASSVAISPDGTTLYYSTNAKDIDRRHIWAVPIGGGVPPRQVTTGTGIETSPVVLSTGQRIAALTADAQRPQSVGLFPARGGTQELVFPTLPRTFPVFQQVVPENVTIKAPDGLEIHNQLFVPRTIQPGERRPAIVFVHGGPVRQMLLGYHYMHFYHIAYAVNQWLASQGYVVLSVNYRSGIGYGRSFRNAADTGGRGNAEYQDVLAAGKYLQTRADVDPKRIGIWGLSYGGVLTAQALARNSDLFVAGVDLAGVHLWGSSLDKNDVSYKSSVISAIDGWKSPVLLVHGDDDRNVAFQQTTGLVQLLRARDVEFELIVLPDDTHETLLHSRWLYVFGRMEAFLKKYVAG